MSGQAAEISTEQLFFQKIDRLSTVPGADNSFFEIRDSFVSQCEIGQPGHDVAIFKLQGNLSSQLSGLPETTDKKLSRHFIIDATAENDC